VSTQSPAKTAIVGVGNPLIGDEGIGVYIAEKLKSAPLPADVVVVDGGTHFWGDEEILNHAQKLIIVDAVVGGGDPGTIYRFGLDELEDETEDIKLSSHDMGLIEKLRMTRLAGSSPEQVVIIGVEPATVAWNAGLSKEIEAKVPEIIDAVMAELTSPETQ
jgi:hydrogenase maturation protease